MTNDRAPIIVGIDTRPIPCPIGDQTVFFLADPTTGQPWRDMLAVGRDMAEHGDEKDYDVEANTKVLSQALGELLADDASRKVWATLDLGFYSLAKIMRGYVSVVTADPS